MSQENEIQSLQQQLKLLQESLDATVADAHKRKSVMLGIMLFVIVAMGIYLSIAYSKISDVDAEFAMTLAEARLHEELSNPEADLETQIKIHFPKILDTLEEQAILLPETVQTHLIMPYIESSIDKAIPEMEAALTAELEKNLELAKQKIGKEGEEITEEEFKKAMDELAVEYGKQLRKMVDQLHESYYARNSKGLIDHFETLAANQGLDERQQRHRKILVLFLALMEKYEQKSLNAGNVPAG